MIPTLETVAQRGDWMTTYSGEPFFPLDPRPADVRIVDIAHGLSNLCRFAGHTRSFYSVAQHSVIVSRLCAPENALKGLLHDASEAYLVDVPRPLKRSDPMRGYVDVEARVQAVIFERFHLTADTPADVKEADLIALRTEQRDLCAMPAGWTLKPPTPLCDVIVPWPPYEAEREFMRRFFQLGGRF